MKARDPREICERLRASGFTVIRAGEWWLVGSLDGTTYGFADVDQLQLFAREHAPKQRRGVR